ncbi:vacuolar sorting protein 9 domain [Striga asiatica]|uniref:Vacuolar sorting protein 9 domain n=1 Tax=Striga asiatica TaxID=4170 RepID=A0A5A7Q962_STRAF|nr:vacuolar sorting protein 9 domain [Striga asiatica]
MKTSKEWCYQANSYTRGKSHRQIGHVPSLGFGSRRLSPKTLVGYDSMVGRSRPLADLIEGPSNFEARILLEPANPALILASPAFGILHQIHRRPVELRHRPLHRHQHRRNPPARRRHLRRHPRTRRHDRVIPPAEAHQGHESGLGVVHVTSRAVEEGVIPGVDAPESRAREAEIEDSGREARIRVVDENGLGRVVDVVHQELAGLRESEDRLVVAVAVQIEARVPEPARGPIR